MKLDNELYFNGLFMYIHFDFTFIWKVIASR